MSSKEFINIAGILTAGWEKNFDDVTLKVWYEALKDLDYKRTELAVDKLTAVLAGRITPAHIRKAYIELECENKSTADMFTLIDRAVADYGRYKVLEAMEYIKKQDEAAYVIIKALGFLNVCDNKPNFLKPQLKELYKEAALSIRNQKVLPDKLRLELTKLKNTLTENTLALEVGEGDD